MVGGRGGRGSPPVGRRPRAGRARGRAPRAWRRVGSAPGAARRRRSPRLPAPATQAELERRRDAVCGTIRAARSRASRTSALVARLEALERDAGELLDACDSRLA